MFKIIMESQKFCLPLSHRIKNDHEVMPGGERVLESAIARHTALESVLSLGKNPGHVCYSQCSLVSISVKGREW